MFTTKKGLQSRLFSAMLASMLGSAAQALAADPLKSPALRFLAGRASKTLRSRGKRYPEQSQRQALRGSRRAQGGPGLEFVEGQGWRARA